MQVETYEIEDQTSEANVLACDAEAIDLVNQLGLTGQQSLINGESLTRQPYAKLTKLEDFVFKTICPEATELSAYNASPIPLRVLQVAAHAKQTNLFEELRVWHPKVVKTDPVLVGYAVGDKYHSEPYLLARWGTALEPFDQLVKKAKIKYRLEYTNAMGKIKARVADILTRIDNVIDEKFTKEDFSIPSTYHFD